MAATDGIFAVCLGPRRNEPEQELRFDVGGRFWMPWHEDPFPEGAAHAAVVTAPWPAPWQLPGWQRMLGAAGAVDESWCVYELYDGRLAGFAFLESRKVGLGQSALFCVGGPVGAPLHPQDFGLALRVLAYRQEAVFIQVEPQDEPAAGAFPAGKWRVASYKRFFEPCTAWVDLSNGESEILAAMKEKGRYNVRLSQKHGVEAGPVEPTDENLDVFMVLLGETLGRDGFSGNSRAHYRAMLDLLTVEEWGGLFFAKKDGEVLAAGIFSFIGKLGTYYYGASTSDNAKRKFMPAYALQWRAMLEAKNRGCAAFDFLGIDDPHGKPGHLAGVTDFKMKFGPNVRRWPAARTLVTRPWTYRFLRLARWAKRLLRR